MSRPIPEHGTANRYSHGCRCKPCTRAAVRADAERTLDRLAGRPRLISAEQVTRHVNVLLGRGLTCTQIGQLAGGIDAKTIKRWSLGQASVQAQKAERILRVPLNARGAIGDVPATGAVRRVRALYALGHLNWAIAQEASVNRGTVSGLAGGEFAKVGVDVDGRIRVAYDRLAMKTGTSAKTRLLAHRNGWAPPLAWDDDTIDDPAAVPQMDAVAPVVTEGGDVAARWLMGESVILGPDDRKEVVQYLLEWSNDTPEEIAARLEMSLHAMWQMWSRLKKSARLEGRPEPWRRAYVPRDRTLNQKQMEEAA